MEAVETSITESNNTNSHNDVQSISIVRVAIPNQSVTHVSSPSTTSAQTYHAIQVCIY